MAVVFTPNTYAGEFAGPYIAEALLTAPTLDRNLITVLPNIKKREILRLATLDVTIQAESCNFNPLGDVTFNERYIDPVTMQVNFELCYKDLRQSWEAAKLRAGRSNEVVPDDLGNFFIEQMGSKIANAIEKMIWQGDTAAAGTQLVFFNGLIKLMKADAAVIKPTFAAITTANVITQLGAIYNAIPEPVKGDTDLVWAAAPNVIDAYAFAQAAVANGAGSYYLNEKTPNFLGYPMERVNGLPASTVVVYRKGNVFFGTDLLSDFNNISTVDMRQTTADKKVRYSADFAAGVNYAYGAEVVLHAA